MKKTSGPSPQTDGNPGAPAPNRLPWLGPLARPLTKFLDAPASSDPFYLTNRTFGQKMKLAAGIGVPCILVGAGIALAVTGYFDRPTPPPAVIPPEQIAAKMLPNIEKEGTVQTNHDLEVADVHVDQSGGAHVAGMVRNNTGHTIQDADLVFDLTDSAGSRLGAVSTRVPRVDGKSSTSFSFPIAQKNAAFVLVREIRR